MSLCSQSCLELCHEARKKGKNPELVKVFGIWVRATLLRLYVAHPVFTVNKLQKRTEIAIHMSYVPEWRFDLFDVLQQSSCALECGPDVQPKATIIPASSELEIPRVNKDEDYDVLQNLEFEEDEEDVAINYRASGSIDFVAISKLKVFLECALSTCDEMEGNSDNPFEFDFPPIPVVSAPSSNHHFTPKKNRIPPARTSVPEDLIQTQSNYQANMDVFAISKPKSDESLIYLNSGLCQPFLPLLISLKQCENDPDKETFVFERMSPLFDGYSYSPLIRTDYYTIDVLTLSIHTLYELLLIHEHLGYVHSDISPNNIMFSSIGRIWKITDFNHSWPIKESLLTIRTGGTVGFVAPEAANRGIFTPASDVYSLGRVLIERFCINESVERYSQVYKELRNICLGMAENDPNNRLTAREALKRSYDLLKGMSIPDKFEVYGKHLILPLVAKELLLESIDEPFSTSKGSIQKDNTITSNP